MSRKVIVIYASLTGNTRDMAEAIEEGLQSRGIDPVMKEVMDADPAELADYDGIILGAFTWGDGDLPDDFLDFYDDMDGLDLTGKKAAVFGSCDSNYDAYGAAVDTLEAKLRELGADVVLDGLKIELTPSAEERETCREFGRQLAAGLP